METNPMSFSAEGKGSKEIIDNSIKENYFLEEKEDLRMQLFKLNKK